MTHTEISGVAHYAVDDDDACLAKLRELVDRLPAHAACRTHARASTRTSARRSRRDALYDLLPADHRMSYDMHTLLARDRRRRQARRVPGRSREGDDLRRRAHRRHSRRRHRQPARPDQRPRRREAALRRNPLRRERREGRVLHRPLRPRRAFRCSSCRTSPASWSGPKPSTKESFAPARASSKRWRRRACRRSCSR